ncbi:uncharacterized protein LOC119098293 [Pollicipes pollicipes]|uniref:uncharacterized protein LOC119098293 n=1 Tax=Pollicipes pollicipes TaxID=41117 RepID=UPI00188502AC|nr:uncharacterized protein LOC119098293 [Pollicipes pollicipes]
MTVVPARRCRQLSTASWQVWRPGRTNSRRWKSRTDMVESPSPALGSPPHGRQPNPVAKPQPQAERGSEPEPKLEPAAKPDPEPEVVPAPPPLQAECSVCGERFWRQDVLVQHMAAHQATHRFSCRKCVFRCRTKHQLADHIRKQHVTIKRRHQPAVGVDRRLRCVTCGIDSFPSFSYFHDHHLYHHLVTRPEPRVVGQRRGQLGLPVVGVNGIGKMGPSPRPVAFFSLGQAWPLRSAEDSVAELCRSHFLQEVNRIIDGATVWSQNERNLSCQLTFQTEAILQRLMVRFDKLHLDCNDHLYIHDGAHAISGNHKVRYSCH